MPKRILRKKNQTIKDHAGLSSKWMLGFAVVFAAVATYFIVHSFAYTAVDADLNNDGKVDVLDLSTLLSNYGTNKASADINNDGAVNILDLSILLSNYGGSVAAPTVSLSASPSSISPGGSATLTWSSTNANSCSSTSPSNWSGSTAISGSKSVSPSATTTYSISCTGNGGSKSASTTVTVSGGSSAEYPALPANAVLLDRQNFESGVLGQSFTSNQCTGDNNQIISDSTEGKIWEAWWDAGDPPVAAHQARCEMSDMGNQGPGEYIYRYKFKVPSDSYLPGTGWHYRLQFHGDNPSTSPPIAVWTHAGPTSSQFNLRFAAGDSSWYQTDWMPMQRDVWHTVQIHVKWSTDSSGWVEFYVDNKPITTLNGTTRLTGQTLRSSQGTPTTVYPKYGLDGGSLPTTGIRIHGYVASFETYSVGN